MPARRPCGPRSTWIEQKIEGGSPSRRSARVPRPSYFGIKGTKHGAWLLFSLWTGFTFVGYFTPIQELWDQRHGLEPRPWETFWIFFYGFATYGNAGFMREQVRVSTCVLYARFQSAMFDHDTLIISYDESVVTRGSRNAGRRRCRLGDCIGTAACAFRYARSASTSATACSISASVARLRRRVMTSWDKMGYPVACGNTRPRTAGRANHKDHPPRIWVLHFDSDDRQRWLMYALFDAYPA